MVRRLRVKLTRSRFDMETRELTSKERTAIRKLVKGMCANYSGENGCLLLGDSCYMLGKWWTGGYCRYFQRAVLPLDPVLEAALINGKTIGMRSCAVCGKAFPISGRKAYCSEGCARKALRKQKREYIRQKRAHM